MLRCFRLQALARKTPPAPGPDWCRPTFAARPGAGDNHRPGLGWPRPACCWPQRSTTTARSALIRAAVFRRSRRPGGGDSAVGPAGSGLAILAAPSGGPRPAVAHASRSLALWHAAPGTAAQRQRIGAGRLLLDGRPAGGRACCSALCGELLWACSPGPLDGTRPTLQRPPASAAAGRGARNVLRHTLMNLRGCRGRSSRHPLRRGPDPPPAPCITTLAKLHAPQWFHRRISRRGPNPMTCSIPRRQRRRSAGPRGMRAETGSQAPPAQPL